MVPVASIAKETSRRVPSPAPGAHGWGRAGEEGLFKVPPRPAPAVSPKRPSWTPGSLPPLLPPGHVGLLQTWGLLALSRVGGQAPWGHPQVRAPAQLVLRAPLTPHRVKSVCGLTSRAGVVSPSQRLSESPARGRCCEPGSLLATRGRRGEVDLGSFRDSLPKEVHLVYPVNSLYSYCMLKYTGLCEIYY